VATAPILPSAARASRAATLAHDEVLMKENFFHRAVEASDLPRSGE
jgi:hypothetical protein